MEIYKYVKNEIEKFAAECGYTITNSTEFVFDDANEFGKDWVGCLENGWVVFEDESKLVSASISFKIEAGNFLAINFYRVCTLIKSRSNDGDISFEYDDTKEIIVDKEKRVLITQKIYSLPNYINNYVGTSEWFTMKDFFAKDLEMLIERLIAELE